MIGFEWRRRQGVAGVSRGNYVRSLRRRSGRVGGFVVAEVGGRPWWGDRPEGEEGVLPQPDGGQELPKSCSFFGKIARGFTNSPANSSRFSLRDHDNKGHTDG